jgi:SulP family sulfate permease
VVAGSLAALVLPVATIGSAFGELPRTLPSLALPHIPLDRALELLPAAFTIAFLAGVESLLSAVVADGMIDGRHRSNAELVAQGVANVGSALVGGLPATGAIARTATGIRSGARSPMAGILHAAFLLLFVLLLGPLMRYVPLAALAAVLLMVAWNMSEKERFVYLMRSSWGDRLVLLTTFVLTVMFDLTVAIEVGVVMAAFVFMNRMSRVVEVEPDAPDRALLDETGDEAGSAQREALPAGVEACRVSGPLFFAAVSRIDNVLDQVPRATRVFILRTRMVPIMDASGVTALQGLLDRCHRLGMRVIFSGLQPQPRRAVVRMDLARHPALLGMAVDFPAAIAMAQEYLDRD